MAPPPGFKPGLDYFYCDNMYKDPRIDTVRRVLVGRRLPKKPRREDTDIGRLEIQIENLRNTVGILVCIVLVLTVYIIIQLFQEFSITFFIPYGLTIVIILVLLLLCSGLSLFDIGRKENSIS